MAEEHVIMSKEPDIDKLLEQIPEELPILPLRNTVALPYVLLPVSVGVPRSIRLIEETVKSSNLVGLVTSKDSSIDAPTSEEVHEVGTVAAILKVVRGDDGTLQVLVQGLERFKVEEWRQEDPYLTAHIELAPDQTEETVETEALQRSLQDVAHDVIKLMPNLPAGVEAFLQQVEDPRQLLYLITANDHVEIEDQQHLLEMDSINDKMRWLVGHLSREREILNLGHKITENAREEMTKAQREYFLRQQLEAIRRELGEADDETAEIESYREKIEESGMSEEAEREANRELSRLEKITPQSPEYGIIKSYLDWLTDLPWSTFSEDNLDIENARAVLDADHYDLEKVKDRIVEYLAVRKLVAERGQEATEEESGARTILCFVGPPGVGKTSLAHSIARALGREFARMSLGGMRDEAEIRGHRRTYIGAMPGRIVQSIKRAGTSNPVFVLDEVDKVGADWRGDPASALLEVLDPQQNHAFRDHYLDVDFDLSNVMFICTANELDPIPAPLRDRMELIHLEGYTEYEKLRIAENYLVPRQRKANGLREHEISFSEMAIRRVTRDYTREAGVRNLERELGRICRKVAVTFAQGGTDSVEITPEVVREYLGRPRFHFDAALRTEVPGVATGLAWTPVGGDVLFVEATRMPGKGELTITGQLGKVMEESVRIAFSFARSKAVELGIDPSLLTSSDFHIHVPEGAIPKDGPSAGITMVTALVSLLTGRAVRSDVGMTGETTLRGQVLPIGGVKQKVLAARRAGLKTVILPQRNEGDLEDLQQDVRDELQFVFVERIDEVLKEALRPTGGGDLQPAGTHDELVGELEVPRHARGKGKG